MADEQGSFRLAGLRAGKYYVSAQKREPLSMQAPPSPDKPDVRTVPTFYPDSLTRDAAAAISLRPAQNLSGIDIRMRTAITHHIRGKLAGELPGNTDRVMISVHSDDNPFFGIGPSTGLGRDRSFDLAGVPPGRYLLSVCSSAVNFALSASKLSRLARQT
jgi:hypothetical protein